MFDWQEYELLDFGKGRKLERFGRFVLDRPSPAAERARPQRPDLWKSADGVFQRTKRDEGTWRFSTEPPDSWSIQHEKSTFHLKPTPFGHVGLFPEQAANWDWIARQVARADRPLKVLNLFAYTGGSTLAAATAGAAVTHVDASKTAVSWARANAKASGLADAPIRWIVEDAPRFVARELKRGRDYDAIVLDPPSYGHGPRGEVWRLDDQLGSLLADCTELMRDERRFVVLTCHSPGYKAPELEATLTDALFGRCGQGVKANPLSLRTVEGSSLNCGVVARWGR
jgi:23S rRNA (cytosine1962-C5)-methyltransferase